MKVNRAKYFIIFTWILLSLLNSCKKEAAKVVQDKINDYLPLTVGAKYKYNYSESYFHFSQGYIKRGQCTWKFISKSVNTPAIYQVEQSFNGYWIDYVDYYSGFQPDSFKIENQISTLSFEGLNEGKVAFTFSYPYYYSSIVTTVSLERFIQSDKTDTCFNYTMAVYRACLRKNVGITNLYFHTGGNHWNSVSYSLIEGPYY